MALGRFDIENLWTRTHTQTLSTFFYATFKLQILIVLVLSFSPDCRTCTLRSADISTLSCLQKIHPDCETDPEKKFNPVCQCYVICIINCFDFVSASNVFIAALNFKNIIQCYSHMFILLLKILINQELYFFNILNVNKVPIFTSYFNFQICLHCMLLTNYKKRFVIIWLSFGALQMK